MKKRIVIACLMLILGGFMIFAGGTVGVGSNKQAQEKKAKDEFVIDEHTVISLWRIFRMIF